MNKPTIRVSVHCRGAEVKPEIAFLNTSYGKVFCVTIKGEGADGIDLFAQHEQVVILRDALSAALEAHRDVVVEVAETRTVLAEVLPPPVEPPSGEDLERYCNKALAEAILGV